MAVSNFMIQSCYPEWTASSFRKPDVTALSDLDDPSFNSLKSLYQFDKLISLEAASSSVSFEPRVTGVAFQSPSQYQISDESTIKPSNGVLLGVDRTLFFHRSDSPDSSPTLFHFKESLIDVLGVSDDSNFASIVLRNGLVTFYHLTQSGGPREIFSFKLPLDVTPSRAEQQSSADKSAIANFLSVRLTCSVDKFVSCQSRNTDFGVENSLEDELPVGTASPSDPLFERTTYRLVVLSASNKLHVLENLLLEQLATNAMSEKDMAAQLVTFTLGLDSLQMNCSSMEVVPAAQVHIDAMLPLHLADRMHTVCSATSSPNNKPVSSDVQCEARLQPLANPLFLTGWSTLDVFSDNVSLFDVPPGTDSGLALDLPDVDVDEVDGAAARLAPQVTAATGLRPQSPLTPLAETPSDSYLVLLGTGEYCLSVVRLNRGGFRSLTRLRRADFSSSGSAPSRVELLALNEPDEAAEEAAGGLPFHLLILDSKGELTLWHLPSQSRVHVWKLPAPVLDMAIVPSSTSPHRLLLLYPASGQLNSQQQQPSPLVLQISELLCTDPFDTVLYRFKCTPFVRLIRGALDQAKYAFIEGDLAVSGEETMDTTRMRSLIHPNSISLLTFFEASPTEKLIQLLHLQKFQEAEELVKLYPDLDIELLYQVKANYLLELLKQLQDKDRAAQNRARSQLRRSIGGAGARCFPAAASEQYDWRTLYSELTTCLEKLRSIDLALECARCCPLPDLSANLELVDLCKSKIRARIEIVETGPSDTSEDKSLLESNVDEIEEIHSLLGTYALLHTDMPVLSEPEKLMRAMPPAAMQMLCSDLAFLTKDWETFRSRGLLQHMLDRLADGDLSAFFIIWYRHPQNLRAHLISDDGHKILEIIQRLPLFELIASIYGISTRSTPIGNVNRSSLEVLSDQQAKLTQLSRFHSLLYWLRSSLLPLLFEYHIHNALCTFVTFALDCGNRVATLVEERESKTFVINTGAGDQNPLLELLSAVITGCTQSSPLRNESSVGRSVAADDLEVDFSFLQTPLNGNPATSGPYSDFSYSCCLLPALYLIDTSQLRTIAESLEQASKINPGDLLITLRLSYLRVLILTRELSLLERLRREYGFEISAKQYREAFTRAKDSGGYWSVDEVLVLRRLNQLASDDLLRMQYSYLVKFMRDNHVDEERLVLQHIGEILSDYQKYQQMERSNPNAAGIPSAENRWIQRCLVLLSIATLTRKMQLEYLAKLAEVATIPWPKELELQIKSVLSDPASETLLPEKQRQRFRHLLQLLELKSQLTNKYGVSYIPTRDSVNSENLDEELEQFACLLIRKRVPVVEHYEASSSLFDALFGVVADIINYRFWLFGSCPLSLQLALYIRRLRFLIEMNKSSDCLLWFATNTKEELSAERFKDSTDSHQASFGLKLRVAHKFVEEVTSKIRRLDEFTEQEIFPLVEFANALSVLLSDSRLTPDPDESHSILRRKIESDRDELQTMDTVQRHGLKIGNEKQRSRELLLDALSSWVRERLDSEGDCGSVQPDAAAADLMPPPPSTPITTDKRVSVKPAASLAKASLAPASMPVIAVAPSRQPKLSSSDCVQFVSLVQRLRIDWSTALNILVEIFLLDDGDSFSGVCDALTTICELLANSNEDRKRFVTGLYSSLKKILTLLQVKLSNMSPGLVSGDEVFFFESLPALSFSLLKFFRLLIAESASSFSISVLLACERLLMLFSFVTSTTLKFFSCQSTDANFAEGLGKTKASESEFLLLKPLVSISENSRDLFRSILPRVANSLIRLVEHLLDDSLTGEQLVNLARVYEQLVEQLAPIASFSHIVFQVKQQLFEFCFEHLLHIIAQPLTYSRSRNVNGFFIALLRLIQKHSVLQCDNVIIAIRQSLNGHEFDALPLLVHMKRLVSLRTDGDVVLSVDKHPLSRFLLQLVRVDPHNLKLMQKCARIGFTFGSLRDEDSLCQSWASFLQRVLAFQRIDPCIRLENETLASFFCENQLSSAVASNILQGAPRQSGSVSSMIQLCELISPNATLEIDTLLMLLERLLLDDALSTYEAVLSNIPVDSSRVSSSSLQPELRARHNLISERVSEVIYTKMEPELQALLRRLCELLKQASSDKRSSILERLVQNIFKINPYFFELCTLYKRVLEANQCIETTDHPMVYHSIAFASGYLRCYPNMPSREQSNLEEYLRNVLSLSKQSTPEDLDQTFKGSPPASLAAAAKASVFSVNKSTPQAASPLSLTSAFSTPTGTGSLISAQSNPFISRTVAIVGYLSRYRLPFTSFVSFAGASRAASNADELTELLDDCFGREVCESTMQFWSGFLSFCGIERNAVNDLIQTKVIESTFKHYLIAHHGKSSVDAGKSKVIDSSTTLDSSAIEDLKTFFMETFAKLFGSFSCLDSVGVCFKTLLDQLPTPLERAEACASYIQILKELREKAQNQSQLSSAGDTSLVTRPSGAVSKASVSALLDGSQLISLNEATFTRAQTFLRDARRMHHRELIKQILLQHNLVTPQQLLAYDMKDPHLNSYVADLLRDALSTKVDARLVSRLFEYPTILSRFAPSAVLSHERFPAITNVLVEVTRDLHKDVSAPLWDTLDALTGISSLVKVQAMRLSDVRPLQATPPAGRPDDFSRPDVSGRSLLTNETASSLSIRAVSNAPLDSELVNKIVMVLAAVCTVDPEHANEQLTNRFRFVTGTTRAYIELLLRNLQPKLEGNASSAQFLSKEASDFLMELLRVRVHLIQALIGTFMESQFEAICNSPIIKLRHDLDGCLVVLLLHRVNLVTELPAHLLLESLAALLRDGSPDAKGGSASWWSNKKPKAMRLEFLCGLLTLYKTLVQAIVEQRERLVSLLLDRRSIDSDAPTRMLHAIGTLFFKYLQMLRSLEVELDDKVSKSASPLDEAAPTSTSPTSLSPELFNPRRPTSEQSRRRFFEKLVHLPDLQLLARIYFYHLSATPVATWLLLWSALTANSAPRILFGATFFSHSSLRDVWSELICKLKPTTSKSLASLRNQPLTSHIMGQPSSHRAIASLLRFAHVLLRCPYHMPDSFRELMPRDTVVASYRLLLSLLNLFVAASNLNFESFIRGFGSEGFASLFREMQAIRSLSSLGSCGSSMSLAGSEGAGSCSDAAHFDDLGSLPVCELIEPLERLVFARLSCKPLEQLLIRAQPSVKGPLLELSVSTAKPLLVAYIQFVLQLHRIPHVKPSVRDALAIHLGETIVVAGPSCLEEAAYLLRELERLPLVGSASSLQQTAAVRTNPRSSVSAQPSVRSALMDVVNSSPLRSSPLRAMNASPARRQRTSVLMHAADALRVDLSNPNTEVVNSAQKLLMHLN